METVNCQTPSQTPSQARPGTALVPCEPDSAIWSRDGVFDFGRRVMDPQTQRDWGSSLFESGLGTTNYESRGPSNGLPVMMIHGSAGPMMIWEPTLDALVKAGMRGVRYDLYGRGYSSRPTRPYDLALYGRQLVDLMDHLAIDRADLVGSSMGCLIAAHVAVQLPNRVRRICLNGPAGWPIETPPAAAFLHAPFIGNLLMWLLGDRILVRHVTKYLHRPESFPEVIRDYAEQLEYRGFKRAILSTLRHMPITDFSVGYRALGQLEIPVLVTWGREDRTFPVRHIEAARALMPCGEFLVFDGAAHLPMYEAHDQVTPRIVSFLS